MAAYSKLEIYKDEINQLIKIGVSIRSSWKIINSKRHKEAQISYSAFYHFVNVHVKKL